MVYIGPAEMRRRKEREKDRRRPLFPKHPHWQECYECWLRSVRERTGSIETQNTYRAITRQFFSKKNRPPDAYTRYDVEEFIHKQPVHRKNPAAPGTQNVRLATLKSFYLYASEYDVPYRNTTRPLMHKPSPCRGIEPRKEVRPNRSLTDDELKQLFASIPRDTVIGLRDYALMSLYFWSARRRTEIVSLKWGDISIVPFPDGRNGHLYRYHAKGHGQEIFTAELPEPAWEAITAYLKADGRLDTMTAESPIFVRHDFRSGSTGEKKALNKHTVNAITARYGARSGIALIPGKQFCTHSLRHTRARMQYRRRRDVREIQKLLGHTSLSHTLVYLAEDEDKSDPGAAALFAEFGHL